MKIAVVVPTYNEADNIERTFRAIAHALPEARIVVVDDDSPDGTARIAEKLSRELPQLHVLVRHGERGLAGAYVHAFRELMQESDIEVFVEMDADGSHDAQDLPRLMDALGKYDVAVGSRYIAGGGTRGWSLWRRGVSRAANAYARATMRVPVRDMTSGFVAYRRELLAKLIEETFESDGYAFQLEMKARAYRSRARITEVPIIFSERREGKSKFGFRIVLEGAILPWKLLAR